MAREIRPGVKRKVLALRKKYCEDLCSEFYMRTGIPRIEMEKIEESKSDISRLMKENQKSVRKAENEALKKAGMNRRDAKEKKIIFI